MTWTASRYREIGSGLSNAGHVAGAVGQRVFPAAPARTHAVRRAVEDRLDPVDLSLFDLEHLGELPGPRRRRPGGDRPPVRRRVVARVAAHVIEEGEAEHQPALLVDGDITPIANARDEVQQSRRKLLPAAPLTRV